MYHTHFSLAQEPFGVSPDPRFFYRTEQHREAVATLFYAIQQRRGFALLAAPAGLGKTSVLVEILRLLEGKAEAAYLPHPHFDCTTVLESVLLALGIEPTTSPSQNHRTFYDYLLETQRAGKTCVVIFDEAQSLTRDTLEAIRLLSNFETSTEKLVQIVLAGQSGLVDMLRQSDCEQIWQRLNVIARLRPLEHQEVRGYIAHRLEIAGAAVNLFAQDALEAIASRSGGVPRIVNTICFNSLSLAYALNHRQVGREEIVEVLCDLNLILGESIRPPLVTSVIPKFERLGRTLRSRGLACSLLLVASMTLLNLPANRPLESAYLPATGKLMMNVLHHSEEVTLPRLGVQMGTFRNRANAERIHDEMASQYGLARLLQLQDGDLWRAFVDSQATREVPMRFQPAFARRPLKSTRLLFGIRLKTYFEPAVNDLDVINE